MSRVSEGDDYEISPGDMYVGYWSYQVLWDRGRKLKPKPFQFGFCAPVKQKGVRRKKVS